MASKTEIPIEIKVGSKDIEQAANSLKALKAELKAAQSAALNGDGAAARRVAELRDQMDDLRDATRQLQGSGLEQAQTTFGLLGEGLENLDLDKVKQAFGNLGNAMAAIPLLLLVEGFKFLVENWKEVIAFGKQLFNVFSDQERAVSALTKEYDAQKEATAKLGKELTQEIALMEIQGKSSDEILAKKKELVALQIKEYEASINLNKAKIAEVQANDSLYESLFKVAGKLNESIGLTKASDALNGVAQINKKERSAEFQKLIDGDNDKIKDANNTIVLEEAKKNKKLADERKKKSDEKKAQDQKDYDELFAQESKNQDAVLASQVAEKERQKKEVADKKKQDEDNEKFIEETTKREDQRRTEAIAKDKAAEKEKAAFKRQTVDAGLNAAKGLSDAFFASQLAAAHGNAAAEKEIRKKQFQVDKAFSASRAVIDGIRSVQAALTIPPPFGQILAVSNGILAAANVAKILAAQFDPGGSAPSTAGLSGAGGGNTAAVQTSAPPSVLPQQQNQTNFDAQGNNLSIRAHVVENDITESQKRIAKLKDQAKL